MLTEKEFEQFEKDLQNESTSLEILKKNFNRLSLEIHYKYASKNDYLDRVFDIHERYSQRLGII
jgi:hypothetical protein